MELNLSFLGAADGVTGSKTLLEFNKFKCLIDCGLFQGPKLVRDQNRQPFPLPPEKIDQIILTHAHLDHSGYLPKIVREGYSGDIFCSKGTKDIGEILLRDAAYLEEEFAKFANDTRYSHHFPAEPLFTQADAEAAIAKMKGFDRNIWHTLESGVSFRFIQAGHIVGASSVQIKFENEFHTKLLCFSGDLGHGRSFVLNAPEIGMEADHLVLEGTYGNRNHSPENALNAFADVFMRTYNRGGVLVIPAFAVGRAQEITYMIRLLENTGRIPKIPVILDSPMSVAAMDIYLDHVEDRKSSLRDIRKQDFVPEKFEISKTPDQSMLTCMRDGPIVVISASGMLSGGRILHHLKHRLPNEKNTVLFCGYQAEGTKGRVLQESMGVLKSIRIHHQEVNIEAEIATMDHLSAHADQSELLAWIASMKKKPKSIIVNHGEPEAQKALAKLIEKDLSIKCYCAHEQKQFHF